MVVEVFHACCSLKPHASVVQKLDLHHVKLQTDHSKRVMVNLYLRYICASAAAVLAAQDGHKPSCLVADCV